MKYLLIELVGFKRFPTSKINTIRITPENKFHWILGTNGSGKSSLISEITPLAAIPSNYEKPGHKKMIIEHKGDTYELLSSFGAVSSFSFIKNGEELNPGHTTTVFNNLVFQHFRVTKDIHEYNIGLRPFTLMSPQERKDWLTRWSDADYSYALGYFKKLLSVYSNTIGSIKVDQNRLVEAKARIMSPEAVVALEVEINYLKDKLKFLTDVQLHPTTNEREVQEKLQVIHERLVQNKAVLRKVLRESKDMFPLDNREDLEAHKTEVGVQLHYLQQKSNQAFEKISEYQKQLDTHMLLKDTDQRTLEESLLSNHKQIESLRDSLQYPYLEKASSMMERYQPWLRELELTVPELEEDFPASFNDQTHLANLSSLNELLHAFNRMETDKANLVAKLQHIGDHHGDNVTCPKCEYTWVLGASEKDKEVLATQIHQLAVKMLANETSRRGLQEVIEKYRRHAQGRKFLENLFWNYQDFEVFWGPIFNKQPYIQDTSSIISQAFNFQHELKKMVDISLLEKSNEEIRHKLLILKDTAQANIQFVQVEFNKLEKEIEQSYLEREKLVEKTQYAERRLKAYDHIKHIQDTSLKLREVLEDYTLQAFMYFERNGISDMIVETSSLLAAREKEYRSLEIQKGQVEMLETNLEQAQGFSKVLKAAVDELSPSKGLIAKGLVGFINHFMGLVNTFIKHVWLYRMEVMPFIPDEDNNIDLDYKFKVLVKDHEVPDIKMTSSGQQEIINLAIRVVAAVFQHMDDGTLFLDEFGARMDTAHKASAWEMISKLLVNSNFEQIFMISHFEGTHIQGLEADITVLCSSNIELPEGMMVNQQTFIH